MNKNESSNFYKNLPVLDHFFKVSDPENYHSLPDDWYIVITDIVNSTRAIGENRYKTVNILGVSSIVGMLNITGKEKLPYVFGGDGSTICIPENLVGSAREVLNRSCQIGRHEFNLELRAAIIPVSYIRDNGYDVMIARYRASEKYDQAVFAGGGLGYAEELLKGNNNTGFDIDNSGSSSEVDFTGLECRWEEVSQQGKEVLTLLIKKGPQTGEKIYDEVLEKMRFIFGFDDNTNPIDPSQLRMNMSVRELMGEIQFRTFGMGWLQRIGYFLKIEIQVLLGKLFMWLGYKSSETDWSLYKNDIAVNSDHRKFDDMLRIVISAYPEQRKQLTDFLEEEYRKRRLAYGLHVTDAAMITCMVFRYHRDHIHFVDGSGGGYVMASKDLKKRLDELS